MSTRSRQSSATTAALEASLPKMPALRAGGLVILLTCSSIAVVIARDFSLYDLSIFEDKQYDDAAVVQAGMDVDHVLKNHPALVANLRDMMQGGTPGISPTKGASPNSASQTISLINIDIPSRSHQQEARNDNLAEVQADLEDKETTSAIELGPSKRLFHHGGVPGGVRGPPGGDGSYAVQLIDSHIADKSDVAAGQRSKTTLQRDHLPTFEAGGQRQSRSLAFASNGNPKQSPRGEAQSAHRRLQNTEQFDFIVAGFPKCGTTSLLKTFAQHPEIDMAAQEQCSIAAPGLTDSMVVQKLDSTLLAMSSTQAGDSKMKRAFKCPNAMFTYKSIGRLEKHSPSAKLVVGIRHPVQMMQSFYNYRITEIYERGLIDTEEIPDFRSLVSSGYKPWKLVSLASVRFELFLQQLGKTVLTPDDFTELSTFTEYGYEFAIKPNNFTIFLYTVDQLEDLDVDRSAKLLADMQAYLGLSSPIPPIGHENKNHFVGDSAHPESISICDVEFASIRTEIVLNAVRTAAWLRDHFLQSPDVYVANRVDFLASLDTWSADPCNKVTQEGSDNDMETPNIDQSGSEETPPKAPMLSDQSTHTA